MNDFIEYLDDLEHRQTNVGPNELAPESNNVVTDDIIYDERKDPEIIQEAIKLQEARQALADRLAAYLQTTDSPTYENFMESDYSLEKDNQKAYEHNLNFLIKNGKVNPNASFNTRNSTSYDKVSKIRPEINKYNPYERPENYELSGKYADATQDLIDNYGQANIKGSAQEMFHDIYSATRSIILRTSDKKHLVVAGDPGVGKTHTVTETCKKFIKQSPTKANYIYEAGDIGSSMSALVPFFYKHSQNCVIVLDDNDKMVMNGLSQDIMNIMKALLDPKAADEKPVTVRANMLDIFAARLGDLDDDNEPIAGAPIKENHLFELDEDALREGRVILSIDGEPVIDKLISLRETHELQNQLKPLREKQERYINPFAKDLRSLREASNKEMLDDMFNEDDDGDEEEMLERDAIRTQGGPKDDEEKKSSFPRRWYFNSSVIFISNLEMVELNTAVLDRVEAVEVKLTLDQFLEHLSNIYGGLGKIGIGTRIDPVIREWSKKCVYTLIGIAIEAWKANKPVFGKPIEINRKLTFRMFDEFVSAWERYAMDHAEEKGETLNVKNTKMLDELSISLIPEMMRRKVIPFLATKVRSS